MDLVILAGGKGSRIRHLNRSMPKPMVKINNIPFLELLINHYAKFNFENIFILAGYKGKIIKKRLHGKIQNFTKIRCIIEKTPKDTGGALQLLKKKIKKDFFLINGDTFFDISNPLSLINNFNNKNIGILSLVRQSNTNSIKFNNLRLDKNKNITATVKKYLDKKFWKYYV